MHRRHHNGRSAMLAMMGRSRLRWARGFTLIELLTAIAVLAVLMLFAVPNLTTWIRNSQLTATANSLLSALNNARSEAMKRGSRTVVAQTGSGWAQGFRIYVDTNANGAYDSGEPEIFNAGADRFPSYLTVSSSADDVTQVAFAATGFLIQTSSSGSTLTITLQRNDVPSSDVAQIRRVIVSPSGRTRVCRPTSTTDANCAASGNEQ